MTIAPATLPAPAGTSQEAVLELNPRHPEARKILRTRRTVHAFVEEAHNLDDGRKLWRLDGSTITIRSDHGPDLRTVAGKFPGLLLNWTTRSTAVPVRGDHPFLLTGNPTTADRGYRKPLTGWDDCVAWLQRKGALHGFTIPSTVAGDLAVRIPSSRTEKFPHSGKAPVTLRVVEFAGILTITEPDLFAAAAREGIGRGRAYGCGMLILPGEA
jgi:hypothetical protein